MQQDHRLNNTHHLTKVTKQENKYGSLCVHAKLLQLCPTLQSHGVQLARLLCLWDYSPGKNTGVGCHALQGIFPKGQHLNLLPLLQGTETHTICYQRGALLTEKSNSSLALVYLTRSIYLVNFNLNLILTLTMHKTCFSGFISTIFLQFLYLYQPVPCIFSSK